MEIIIEKENIIEELHRISAHLGNKLSVPELVASTADDESKIDIMLSASVAELFNILSPYAVLKPSDTDIIYELNMPANWKSSRNDSLRALCKNYLIYSVFARWLDFVKGDSAALYRALNKENVVAILHILSLREKPQRN